MVTTAHKRGVVDEGHLRAAIESMTRLNRRAAELAATAGLHSATDITGYGLLGHAEELARNSGVGLRIGLGGVPLLPGALDYARRGIVPGGLLFALPEDAAGELIGRFAAAGEPVWRVGGVVAGEGIDVTA